jgi:hypothetical protein
MQPKRLLQNLLLTFTIILVFINGYLLKASITYQKSNRRLILQNDSLSGVIIEYNRSTNFLKLDSLSLNYGMDKQQNSKR